MSSGSSAFYQSARWFQEQAEARPLERKVFLDYAVLQQVTAAKLARLERRYRGLEV